MPTYSVHVPLLVQYQSSYDSPTFSSDYGVKIPPISFQVGLHSVTLEEENSTYILKAMGIEATDESKAATSAANDFEMLSAALSLDLQGKNPNSHYGHPRFSWRSRDIIVQEAPKAAGLQIRDALGIKVTHHFKAENSQRFIEAQASHRLIRFLMATYYESLGPMDMRSKFYNAFVVIEFIEANLVDRIKTTAMIQATLLDPLIAIARAFLESHGISKDGVNRLIERSLGILRTATVENRASKLASILNDVLKIASIEYATKTITVDKELAKSFINQRNRLFHAAEASEDIKPLTDQIILVVEKILLYLVNEPGLAKSHA